ncbi:MAG: lipopolysaccharide heptosyltransferase I [Pseudomonadales bacterium]|jgi:heptosyltransferase-1|nr:lipopolysaccharide heptosyltransferase I [Pseudomonadales bacterium]
MKRVLVIKTSSMGDVIHALPAISDACVAFPDIQFDWVVEEAFAEIPAWHAGVDKVIPVAIRRWRKNILKFIGSDEWHIFRTSITRQQYDFVIDAQGLIKSAFLARFANGIICGYHKNSAREPLASIAYQRKVTVAKDQHAVERIRELFAKTLGYDKPQSAPDYGVDRLRFGAQAEPPYVLFLHGTTRADKHWPDEYWQTLCRLLCDAGMNVRLPWWTDAEHRRARMIAETHPRAEVLPRTHLAGMAATIACAQAVVAVDTGLGHLAAALAVPTLSLYGPTSPRLIGAYGPNQFHLCAQDFTRSSAPSVKPEIFASLTPAVVFSRVRDMLGQLDATKE